MKASVFVTLKPSVFDPQGQTIADALHSMGYARRRRRAAGQVLRAGARRPASAEQARALAAEVADKLLANPVIESYRIEVDLASSFEPAGGLEVGAGSWKLTMKFAVIVFPGSNCDHDAYHAAKHVLGQDAEFVWHKETSLKGADVVILPGGFSHGDYLRTGAIARFSPVMAAVADVRATRRAGARHLQRLPDSARGGLLPGAMLRNRDLKFHCEHVCVRVEQTDTPFTAACVDGPGAAACRSRTAKATTSPSPRSLDALEATGRVVFRYCDARGRGHRRGQSQRRRSTASPASATSARNVVGLMPHPERACEPALGSADGLVLFESVVIARWPAHGRRCGRA